MVLKQVFVYYDLVRTKTIIDKLNCIRFSIVLQQTLSFFLNSDPNGIDTQLKSQEPLLFVK